MPDMRNEGLAPRFTFGWKGASCRHQKH